MKSLLQTCALLVFGILFVSCKSSHKAREFSLSREDAIELALKSGGELVDVVGDKGPFARGGSVTGNYGVNEGGGWSGGTSKGGHKLNYEVEEHFYHVIHIFDSKDDGALLIGVKMKVPEKEEN